MHSQFAQPAKVDFNSTKNDKHKLPLRCCAWDKAGSIGHAALNQNNGLVLLAIGNSPDAQGRLRALNGGTPGQFRLAP